MGTPVQPGNLVNLDFGLEEFSLHNCGPRGQEMSPEAVQATVHRHSGIMIESDNSGSMAFPLKGKPINPLISEVGSSLADHARALSAIAVSNPKGLELVLNLLNAGPCQTCRFVKQHCKCKESK